MFNRLSPEYIELELVFQGPKNLRQMKRSLNEGGTLAWLCKSPQTDPDEHGFVEMKVYRFCDADAAKPYFAVMGKTPGEVTYYDHVPLPVAKGKTRPFDMPGIDEGYELERRDLDGKEASTRVTVRSRDQVIIVSWDHAEADLPWARNTIKSILK
jgi:hypothetical protein